MNQLDRIELMLSNLLYEKIQWIGGYAWGMTDNGDPFILLYPLSEKLKEKVCRVYPHMFKKLPNYIPRVPPSGARLPSSNPSRLKAIKQGNYYEIRPFQILIREGKDTKMGKEKRFHGVLKLGKEREKEEENKPVDYGDYFYLSGDPVPRRAESVYLDYQEKTGKRPFSGDDLKRWYDENIRNGV